MSAGKTASRSEARQAKYNLPAPLVTQVYNEVEKVFGNDSTLIGGRAVTVHCNFPYRTTKDIDFLVPGSISSDKLEKLESYGWRPASASENCELRHFEKVFYYNNEQIVAGLDINTTASKRCLPYIKDKELVLRNNEAVKIMDGTDFGPVRVASVAALITMKLFTVEKERKDHDLWRRIEVAKHEEDIYMLVALKYGSTEAFIDACFEEMNALLGGTLEKQKLSAMLERAFENGREHAGTYSELTDLQEMLPGVLGKKAEIDKSLKPRTDTDDWLDTLVTDRIERSMMELERKDTGQESPAVMYPEALLKEFSYIYRIYAKYFNDLDYFARVVSEWTGRPKRSVQKDLNDIRRIGAGIGPD